MFTHHFDESHWDCSILIFINNTKARGGLCLVLIIYRLVIVTTCLSEACHILMRQIQEPDVLCSLNIYSQTKRRDQVCRLHFSMWGYESPLGLGSVRGFCSTVKNKKKDCRASLWFQDQA